MRLAKIFGLAAVALAFALFAGCANTLDSDAPNMASAASVSVPNKDPIHTMRYGSNVDDIKIGNEARWNIPLTVKEEQPVFAFESEYGLRIAAIEMNLEYLSAENEDERGHYIILESRDGSIGNSGKTWWGIIPTSLSEGDWIFHFRAEFVGGKSAPVVNMPVRVGAAATTVPEPGIEEPPVAASRVTEMRLGITPDAVAYGSVPVLAGGRVSNAVSRWREAYIGFKLADWSKLDEIDHGFRTVYIWNESLNNGDGGWSKWFWGNRHFGKYLYQGSMVPNNEKEILVVHQEHPTNTMVKIEFTFYFKDGTTEVLTAEAYAID